MTCLVVIIQRSLSIRHQHYVMSSKIAINIILPIATRFKVSRNGRKRNRLEGIFQYRCFPLESHLFSWSDGGNCSSVGEIIDSCFILISFMV